MPATAQQLMCDQEISNGKQDLPGERYSSQPAEHIAADCGLCQHVAEQQLLSASLLGQLKLMTQIETPE